MFKLIASFVHGNALGVVLEPVNIAKYFEEHERPDSWMVRIGPLVPEAAIGTEYPGEDYDKVMKELVAFCTKHGVSCEKPRPDWFRRIQDA